MSAGTVTAFLLVLWFSSAPAADCGIADVMRSVARDPAAGSSDYSCPRQRDIADDAASPTEQSECELGTVDDIQPADAIRKRIAGRDAWIFSETLMHQWEASAVETVDAVLLMSGSDVMGGNVVLMVTGECIRGYKFVTVLELIHADEIVTLFGSEPALLDKNHLDEETLAELAAAGNPVAQFHAGLVAAWGRGGEQDRPASVDWLRQAADKGYAPAILALGMALSGPYAIHDGVTFIGEPPPTDALTDRVQACYQLFVAGKAPDRSVASAGQLQFDMNWEKMSRKERTACQKRMKSR